MDRSDRHSLPYVIAGQAQKHVTVNEATRALDALVQMSAASMSVSEEPSNPVVGEGYILPIGKTGLVWSGFADHAVAVFQDNAWMAYPATVGMTVYVEDVGAHVVWTGSEWAATGGGSATSAPEFGVNAFADQTNKLAVKSDAVLFSHDDVTPGTGDMRAVLNKIDASHTASVLFQDNFSARAEFGLTGSDDFVIKVSADGTTFFDAIKIDRATGEVSFPSTSSFVGGEPSFSPRDVSGLVGWWDPSDSATITYGVGSAVEGVADKSDSEATASQTDTGAQPVLSSGALAGRDALTFAGGQSLDLSPAASNLSGDDAPFSIHMVLQSSQVDATQIPFGIGNSQDATQGFWFGLHSSGAFRASKRSSGTVDEDITSTDELPHFFSIVHDGTSTSVWVDGFRVLTDVTQDVAAMAIDRMTLGAWERTSASFHFEGVIGEVIVYAAANSDQDVRTLQRYLGERWFGIPTQTDLFLAIGQSNMRGKGDATLSPSVPLGIGYEWMDDSHFHAIEDPVGPADTGSCLPAFANGWHNATGRGALVVNAAVGSTSLLPEADAGLGNWDKTQGTLYTAAITAANLAHTHASSASIYELSGVYALWAQGERDAANVDAGTPGVTGANYEAALQTLATNLVADMSGTLGGFFLFELGARDDATAEAAWAEIRTAQNNVASADDGTYMVFTGAKDFPAQAMMIDNLHYTQTGYDVMGTNGAAAAAATIA